MARVNLDDFEEDFEGALGKFTADVIAEVERDTQGMTDLGANSIGFATRGITLRSLSG